MNKEDLLFLEKVMLNQKIKYNNVLFRNFYEHIKSISNNVLTQKIDVERYEHKIDIVIIKVNDELIVLLVDIVGFTINLNINEFDYTFYDDKQILLLDEFFKGNYRILEYYYDNFEEEIYTEFVWDNFPEHNIKENRLFKYPYLLKTKERWKAEGKLKILERYKKLPN